MHQKFKKKLVLTKKRLEMQRITEENQRLLRRIQEVPPAYNHLEWEEEAKRREVIKKCMALYPEFYEDPKNQTKSMIKSDTLMSHAEEMAGYTKKSERSGTLPPISR